jgi:hypothetical protein
MQDSRAGLGRACVGITKKTLRNEDSQRFRLPLVRHMAHAPIGGQTSEPAAIWINGPIM